MALDLSGATNQANQATSTGQGAISSFDPTATGQQNLSSLDTMLTGQGNQTNDFQKAYEKAVSSNPSVTSLYNTGNEMFNVPALQTTATQLQNAVNQVTPNSYNLAKGFDYSNAQVQNNINKQLQFLQPEANAATANANTASGLASNYVNAGIQQNQMNLLPIQNSAQLLAQQQAAQQTGWNQNAANTLAALTAKMNAGIQLSGQEMQMAQSLAAQEEAYQQQVLQGQQQMQQIGQQQKYQTVNNNLINTLTGQIMNPAMLTAKTGTYTFQ